MPLPKTHLDTKASTSVPMTPLKQQETNGAAGGIEPSAVDTTVKASTSPVTNVQTQMPPRQTHGAVIPPMHRGNFSSVSELTGRPTARGSIGSFDTLEAYSSYISNLSQGELSRHAIEEAKIVPIAERARLIRRLESEYTAIASRTPQHRANVAAQQPKPYTQEQIDTLKALQNKMLKR